MQRTHQSFHSIIQVIGRLVCLSLSHTHLALLFTFHSFYLFSAYVRPSLTLAAVNFTNTLDDLLFYANTHDPNMIKPVSSAQDANSKMISTINSVST